MGARIKSEHDEMIWYESAKTAGHISEQRPKVRKTKPMLRNVAVLFRAAWAMPRGI
jgi:hypothetical protein